MIIPLISSLATPLCTIILTIAASYESTTSLSVPATHLQADNSRIKTAQHEAELYEDQCLLYSIIIKSYWGLVSSLFKASQSVDSLTRDDRIY